MGMAICHTCKGPVHDNPDTPCNPFRIREQIDRLRAENADLLAALKELTDAHAEMTAAVGEGSTIPFVPVLKRHVAAWETARAAIAKAEGRSK